MKRYRPTNRDIGSLMEVSELGDYYRREDADAEIASLRDKLAKAEASVAVLTVDKEFARKNIGFEGVGVSDDKVSIQCRCCAMLWLVPAADFHGGKFDMRFPSESAANPLPEAKP